MKNLLTIILAFTSLLCMSQTQGSLPTGSKPFSSNIYISPNADLWTGKPGTYVNFAKKRYVDSLYANPLPLPVSTTSLKINYNAGQSGVFRLPATNNQGAELVDGGLFASYSPFGVGLGAIAIRNFGKLQSATGSEDLDVVNFFQLKTYVNPIYGSSSSSVNSSSTSQVHFSNGSSVLSGDNTKIYFSNASSANNARRSLIQFSDNSVIENPSAGYPGNSMNNFISNSMNARISGNYVQNTSIIGSKDVKIGRNRIQSAIIASTQSEIKDYVSGAPGFAKWNSAIIAGLLCSVGESNSYTLVTGRGNHSAGSATLVCGRYNVIEPMIGVDNPLKKTFVVGAGTGIENDEDTGDESLITRKNAFYVTHGGRAWVQQEIEVDAAGKGLVLKSPDGSRWQISVSNTGQLTSVKLP